MYEECKKILETFQNDKAQREDGFTVKFYTYFFELLGNNLIASYIYIVSLKHTRKVNSPFHNEGG